MAYYIDGSPGRKIKIHGKKYLYFGGTAYLGLQTDKDFQDLFIKNIRKYGTNHGTSRKSNVRIPVYGKAEALLASIVGSDAALTMSSGYLAGQLIAQNLNRPRYRLFYAPNTHSALHNNPNKPYTDLKTLNLAITQHLALNDNIIPVLLLDSIDFIGHNFPKFDVLSNLPLDKIILIVDDSHGIGIIGENGEGAFRTLQGFNAKELIICCSLGKGYGIQAGAVLGSNERIEQLRGTAFFGGASPATPFGMASFIEGQSIYTSKRSKLYRNMAYFEGSLNYIDFFHHLDGHPTYTFSSPKMADYIQKKGFIPTNFKYPAESSSVMSRIVLSSHHTQKDIGDLCKCINTFLSDNPELH